MKKVTAGSIFDATAAYEKWLAGHLRLVPEDLERKHRLMKEDLFSFFRATFYRWAQLFPVICPEAAAGRAVLAVGDLHVENFGTWRDAEGRLAWGINDFDEVSRMPWAIDLVRLAASAFLATDAAKLGITHREAARAIFAGYRAGLASGGQPWVLAGRHHWLNRMVRPGLRDPAVYWEKLSALPPLTGRLPGKARKAIQKLMPERTLDWRVSHRVAGLGSLGRQRFNAVAQFEGGLLCREAKALAPSAWDWARERPDGEIRYQEMLEGAIRAHDPFVRARDGWLARRLAPDCVRIELAMVPRERDEARLLHAMGWETANVHLGSGEAAALSAEARRMRSGWLHTAARRMVSATRADWELWRESGRR
jgi:Uncharacterized protein conserved in bacteria (DUF2252)